MTERPPTYMEQLQDLRRRVDDKIRAEALRLHKLGIRHDEEHLLARGDDDPGGD